MKTSIHHKYVSSQHSPWFDTISFFLNCIFLRFELGTDVKPNLVQFLFTYLYTCSFVVTLKLYQYGNVIHKGNGYSTNKNCSHNLLFEQYPYNCLKNRLFVDKNNPPPLVNSSVAILMSTPLNTSIADIEEYIGRGFLYFAYPSCRGLPMRSGN